MKYVLKGNILEYNYQIFGVYSNWENLLDATTKVIKRNLEITEMAQQDYGYSGLVYYKFDTMDNDPETSTEDSLIYWDLSHKEAYIKKDIYFGHGKISGNNSSDMKKFLDLLDMVRYD